MPAQRDHLRVPHRDPRHVLDGHGLRVVGQQVRRRPADSPQRLADAPGQGAQLLVPDRDHDPEPRPRQPRAEQQRLPAPHQRPVAPVPLQEHSRLRDPGPVAAAVACVPGRLHVRDRPARGPLRPPVSHRGDLAVHHVAADLPLGAVDPFLDLLQVRVDRLRPRRLLQRVPARVPDFHVPGDGLRIAAGQLRRRPRRTREVESLENLHDLPVRLGHRSLRVEWGKANHLKPTHTGGTASITTHRDPAGEPAISLDLRWPQAWNSDDRVPGVN